MSISDPIADMLTRIRNGQMATKASVKFPSSKRKRQFWKITNAKVMLLNLQQMQSMASRLQQSS